MTHRGDKEERARAHEHVVSQRTQQALAAVIERLAERGIELSELRRQVKREREQDLAVGVLHAVHIRLLEELARSAGIGEADLHRCLAIAIEVSRDWVVAEKRNT